MRSGALGLAGAFVVAAAFVFAVPSTAWAHCDTLDGPVAKDARKALAGKNVTPALKWVKPQAEAEVKVAFSKAVAVRGKGAEARDLADRYFIETLVRLHRAGEGAPFTGLKPAGAVEPPIAAADRAIASGSVESVARATAQHAAQGVRQRYARVQAARRHADESVAAGRRYVAAYVDFIHYVERLNTEPSPADEKEAEAGPGGPGTGHED